MPAHPDPEPDASRPDQRLVRALEHPVRVGFLKLLAERERLTASEALGLLNRPDLVLGNVAYHVRVLNLLGLVEPDGDPSRARGLPFAPTPAGEDAVAVLGGRPPSGENGN
jgi:hypothetical protein